MTVQAASNGIAAAALVTTAETVIGVLPYIGQQTPRNGNLILGFANITPGTAATLITLRVRTGTTTAGTLVGIADAITAAAGAPDTYTFGALDLVNFPAGNQYCVTAQQTTASGNATVNDVLIWLDIISAAA